MPSQDAQQQRLLRDMPVRATFVLLTYNHSSYVQEAVEHALSQECEPIKIFISDDASTDDTVEKIKSAIKDYCGPYEVVVNFNNKNMGTAAHINFCMKNVESDYVVIAAGDDLSCSTRVASLLRSFGETDALLLHSRVEEIDSLGNESFLRSPFKSAIFYSDTSAEKTASSMALYIGASGAWHRSLFEKYGDIDEGCFEDLIFGFRAALEQRVAFVDQELVKYRVSIGASSQFNRSRLENDIALLRTKALGQNCRILSQRIKDTHLSSHPAKTKILSILHRELIHKRLRQEVYKSSKTSFLLKNRFRLANAISALLAESLAKRRLKYPS